MTLYEIVGVAKTATKSQIKKAYRMKANVHHPDKGGDPEKFKRLVLAYNILFDEEKRARYDAGESPDAISKAALSEDQQILTLVLGLFCQAVATGNPDRQDIIQAIRMSVNQSMQTFSVESIKEQNFIKKFESAAKRMKTKGPDNAFVAAAKSQIETHQRNIAKVEEQLRIGRGALKFLEAYSYEIDAQVMTVTMNPGVFINLDPFGPR